MILRFLLLVGALGALSVPARAADSQPIEISADKALEWHRTQSQYIADGNAVIVQGSTTLRADRVVADYRDSAASSTDIYRITGTDAVSITDKGNTATGDKVVYTLDDGIAVMTGKALRMDSPEQTVTASDRFEYHVRNGTLTAHGKAKVVRGTDTLMADRITAILSDGNTLDRLEATGNVTIITPAETLTGERAVYNAKAATAVVAGSVKITRGQNVLNGERAEIDLKTDISRLFGSSIEDGQTGGRVKGVFYPDSGKKTP